jgi:RNA-directed DNA polymerase
MRRWLKAGGLEDGVIEPSEAGGPQGGRISVVWSNRYLHDVRDRWWERRVNPRRHGEASLIRDLDACVVGCQDRADAERFQQVVGTRLAKGA